MRLLLDKLREEDLSSTQIGQLIYGRKIDKNKLRSVQNYLQELIGLGLVSQDSSSGLYHFTENRTVFQSKSDYEIALKHSKKLIPKIDSLWETVDLLAFPEENDEQTETSCLLRHIRNGYSDFYLTLQEYRAAMEKSGLAGYNGFPKPILAEEFPSEPPKDEKIPVRVSALLPDSTDFEAFRKEYEAKEVRDNNPEIRNLVKLRDSLIGKLYSLVGSVEHGSPLLGSCDFCPHKKLTIKD